MTLSEEVSRDICRRLETAEGHLRGVRRMVEGGKDCEPVLEQLVAVRSAIDKTVVLVLREHLERCVRRSIEGGDRSAALRELEAISRYLATSVR